METLIPIASGIGIVIVVAVLLVILIKSCWKVAETNQLMVITGLGKPRIIHAGGAFVIPLVQKVNYMTLENIQVDFTSRDEIPTKDAIHILVDAVANMSISLDPERQRVAASKFVGWSVEQIQNTVIRILEGNIREIISQTEFEELIRGDKKIFSERVMENVTPNLADLGIDLTTFNIQSFSDKNGIIKDLGIENVEKIKKDAQIAAAKAKSDVAIAQAAADQAANEAKVRAATKIAEEQTEFAIKKAKLQEQADIEQAKADAAKAIETENQRRTQEIATANANLARQEKEIELQERAVAIEEKKLEAEVKKTAEAKKYAEQQAADARLYATQKASEAELFERAKKAEAEKIEAEHQAAAQMALAEAIRAQGEAEAAAERAKGEAEAAAIQAKLQAEANGLKEKAEAMKQYGEAAMTDMQMQLARAYVEQLPAIAQAVGEGYQGVDKIVMLGSDSNQLAGNIISTTTQISEGLSNSLGIDLKSLLSGVLGGKMVASNLDNE